MSINLSFFCDFSRVLNWVSHAKWANANLNTIFFDHHVLRSTKLSCPFRSTKHDPSHESYEKFCREPETAHLFLLCTSEIFGHAFQKCVKPCSLFLQNFRSKLQADFDGIFVCRRCKYSLQSFELTFYFLFAIE